MKIFEKRLVSFLLALIIVVGMLPPVSLDAKAATTGLDGKTISILGDSISSYQHYSNGTAAGTTNSTISNGAIYYPRSGFDVTVDSTWWYQAAQALDMEILVNNSWSGSCLLNTRSGTVGAYVDRCVQLHDDTGDNAGQEPDIIAIFLGTNDYYTYPGTLGSYESVAFDTLITQTETGYTYAEPTTSMEAYAIILHKIAQRYPEAQVYCFTLLPRVNSTSQPTAVNEDIKQLANHFGAITVDLHNCGIQPDSTHMGDNLHPNSAGMDAMTNAFVSAVLKNSGEMTYDVSFNLDGVVAMEGTTRTVISGDEFRATLKGKTGNRRLNVSVKMGGADITETCYVDGVVQIPAVNGDVVITASLADRDPLNFRWEYDAQKNALVSGSGDGNTENALTMTSGSITDGKFSKVKYTLDEAVILKHDKPWAIEWKSSGTWSDTTDGALLFAGDAASSTADKPYLYRRHNSDFIAFGVSTGGQYHNYGVKLGANGIDGTIDHTYKLENRLNADGSNMVYLYVDDQEIGPMNHHWIGGTDKKETVDWLNGQDLVFTHMGTSPHTIGNCYIDYIQVWENGKPDERSLQNFRWEIENNAMVSVTTNGNTINDLTLNTGSITGGVLKNIRYSLSKAVNLYHDVPWVMEWRSSGNWDGMLLASNLDTAVNGTTYLFRFAPMKFLALGDHTNTWNNYGLVHEIDMSVPHLFRLENRIGADGTNTVYLLVDGVEIDAMHHYYNSGTNQNKIVNWANGRDLVFSNIGTSSHPVNNMQLEYLQIWEKGHDHDYRSAVTAPTCTEEGYTTYTCDCGSSYVGDYVDAKGHSYENGSCKVCGAMASNPFAGKTIACIGDSITAAYGVTKDKTDYVKLLADRLEMNYIRLGASGTTLCANGGRVCNIDKLTESKLQGADVVTIAMGINDFCGAGAGYYKLGDINSTDSSTIYGAVRMWCEQIVELRKTDSLKDTQFYFMTPLITSWNNSVTSARNWDQSKVNIHGYTLRDLCNAIIEMAALYDVAVIDMNLISGLYYVSAEDNNIDVFGGDGVHPGDEGHAMMAAALEDALLERYLLDDHDHSYGSWITTTYPDCEGGEEKRVCGICRATESRTLAGKGHSYENGYCTDCGAEHPELADYAGKVISIMGDSISTFAGYIPVADGFNMEHLARYPQDNLLTDVNETWWMQVVAELDAKLGINDSWRGATLSGGAPVTTGTTGENAAMSNLTRIQNLGSNGTPDVILLYGGTNDLAHVSKVGSFDPANAPTEVDLTTKKWDNLADGFLHTILRMRHYYPEAVIVAMLPTYTASYYSDEKLAQGNAVMAAICEHYGIAYVDLRESGVTAGHLPDGIHPGKEGMDLITEAVVDALLSRCDVQAGENVVYPVSHELEGVKASLGHWKGVSAGKAFVETLTGDDLSVTVTMDGADITEEVYENGVISIEEVTGALVITAKGVFTADGHLQLLPETAYNTTNLWDVLEHDEMYYAANGWVVHSSGNVKSVTVPVVAGDRIRATSFGAAGENGANMNGIRVTYFTKEGLLKTMSPDEVYKEFSKNGYLTVPEGAVAVCVPMWVEDGAEMYILTLPAIPSDKNVHLSQKAKLQPDGSFTFTLEIYASEKVALYEDAVIRYVLNQGFVMTEKSEVKAVRVSELLSGAVLYEVTVEATELTVTVDGGVLDVTGYDLSKSYVAQDHAGSKLVITISNVEATDAVLWNENMDISTADSGIWADGAMAVAFAKGSAFFRKNVHVMDYAQQITLDEENVIHLDADGMGCFGEASIRLEMTCGTAVVEEDGVVYTPGTMQWNGYDRFYAFAKKNETYSWTKVAVIPANNVYYEDSFVATSDEDAAAGAGIYYTNGTKPEDVAQDVWDSWNGQWESVSDNKTGNSVENSSDVQGWIENLAGQTGFTGGSAHLVQAMLGQNTNGIPKATFTFTGTGVDIYSFTNNTTGTVMVQVSDVKGIYPSSYYIVDTGANTAEGYYQVPTISFMGKGHSTYQVTIMVTTAAARENRFAFYLDGIRVYNPLGENAKDETVEDAYGDENHAVFGSARQMLLDAGSFTGETGEGTGFVFIDQLPDSENSGSTNMIGTYETYGPKNEVYLAKGQAIAFKVDESLYSRVQVGLKSLTGEEVQAVVSYFDEESDAAAQGMVRIAHTADLYYELMPIEGYVVIRNTSDAILAVTKVKLMVSGDPQQISAQVEKVSQAEVLEAVDEFDALPMMTYRLRNFRPDVEITQPEASPEELAMAQMRALLEKLFGSIRKWFD